MDSTSCNGAILMALDDIMDEWKECKRRGQITLHSDGCGIKKIEFNYSIDLK
jgi:hypothetical protein